MGGTAQRQLLAAWACALAPAFAAHSADDPYGRSGDPRQGPPLFAKVVPLLRDPRCLNCHGLVDPFRGQNHGGGDITPVLDPRGRRYGGAYCDECHSEAREDRSTPLIEDGKPVLWPGGEPHFQSEWRVPASSLFFTGKNDRQLCHQLAQNDLDFIRSHFGGSDDRVNLGFIGKKGMEIDPLYGAETKREPPLGGATQGDQLRLVIDWWTKGYAACGFTGTVEVTYVETFTWDGVGTMVGNEHVLYTLLPDGRVRFDGAYDQSANLSASWPDAMGTNVALAVSMLSHTHGDGTAYSAPVDVALDSQGNYTIHFTSARWVVATEATEKLPIGSPLPVLQLSSRDDHFSQEGSVQGALDSAGGERLQGSKTSTWDSRVDADPSVRDLPPTVKTTTVIWDLTIQ